MWKQLFAMLAQGFLMITNMFVAGTKLSNAAVHSASYVEGAAAGFNERTSLERLEALEEMRAKYDIGTRKRAAQAAMSVNDMNKQLAAIEAEAALDAATQAAKSA